MKIEGQNNLALISEAMSELQSGLEVKLMNQRFANTAEKELMCAKLRKVRGLHNHIQSAATSEVISNILFIQP